MTTFPKIPKKAYKEKEKRNNLKKTQSELDLNNISPKISDLLVKDLYKYKLQEECGLRIESRFITKDVKFPTTELQDLHNYFYFHSTGKCVVDNVKPEPILLKTGKPSIEYVRINSQIENFKLLMSRMNFSIEQTRFEFTNPKFSGLADIVAHDNNIKSKDIMKKRVIIDLSTTSLLNDKWSSNGWGDENFEEKEELLLKAIHLKLLAKYEWGIEDIPFYYFVFSNKNNWEYKVFKINVFKETLQEHYSNLLNIKKFLDYTMKNGWIAYPNYSVCRECPLSISSCNFATDIPKIQEVKI